ncbi:hypothetical protein MAPG_03457 [Magnaporthiopsis poae ATCC 64411]|uniref:Uncharacterized protein n=1 Tax=Magnaporthiopsis poae (strain ATCC 64411 / 73-15) TaxID=644358 RepID=A0A0C4DU23_MAGP6|nr:hypothetical protein MAPG_03457 [Magnaporthiopsis poae ATCC 64411]
MLTPSLVRTLDLQADVASLQTVFLPGDAMPQKESTTRPTSASHKFDVGAVKAWVAAFDADMYRNVLAARRTGLAIWAPPICADVVRPRSHRPHQARLSLPLSTRPHRLSPQTGERELAVALVEETDGLFVGLLAHLAAAVCRRGTSPSRSYASAGTA